MSEVNHAAISYPPHFPILGRLPSHDTQVQRNSRRQDQWERDYHNALAVAAGRRGMPPCCKTVHISLCFDGTGNNLNNDLYESTTPHPTNIARLFRASIGDGYVGGTGHNAKARRLTDAPGTGGDQYFKYYMPGVGTPFAEIGDLDYSNFGLGFGGYGEERINWGLMMILDALRRTLQLPRQDNASLLAAVKAMGSIPGLEWGTGHANRSREFRRQLEIVAKPLSFARAPIAGQCTLLGFKLYVYGFSRGAAAARAFVSWLNQLLTWPDSALCLPLHDVKLPISVEYLGLLDTVASVGLADIMPVVSGHMSWADGNQRLPDSGLVKRCLHLVASHEQRLSFPLDSIRRPSGEYPANCVEVVYPGVHSDQGGGYPPGDQGKAIGKNDGLLLSQIALNDLYADAFAYGAPLKVPKAALPESKSRELWRVMDLEVIREFDVATELADRFNAWRQVTLGLPPTSEPLPDEQPEDYQPTPANHSLEQAVREQMAWLTAWRIDRYAFASLKQTDFYQQASDTHANQTARDKAEQLRNDEQAAIEKRRRYQIANERSSREPKIPLEPGLPDFDPDIAQTQLRDAAEEFGADYRGPGVLANAAKRVARLGRIPGLLALQVTAEARAEREQMRTAGLSKVRPLFPRPQTEYDYEDEHKRGNIDENRNANQPEGLLRTLFDDHVHDSRAWFLYSAGRETGGSYFSERMVFFGDAGRRDLALYSEAEGQIVVSAAHAAQPPVMDAERLAQAHKAIDELWEADYAKARGVNDAQA